MHSSDTQYAGLAFAGATPFVACAVLPLLGIAAVPPVGSLHDLVASYGLAILCFLCGTHWTVQLRRPRRTPFNLFYTSNAILLVVWFTFVLTDLTRILLVQVLAFGALLFVDLRLRDRELVSGSYFSVRTVATVTACLSLLVILLSR